MHFDLSKLKNVSIESFDMEEMTGRDSLDAAARVLPRGNDAQQVSGYELQIAHRNSLIAQSISRVDGVVVPRPYTTWETWSLRTQEFVIAAYNRLNDASKAEVEAFLVASFAAPVETSRPTTSGSGSTSHDT